MGVVGVLERFGHFVGWGPRLEPGSDPVVSTYPADVVSPLGSAHTEGWPST